MTAPLSQTPQADIPDLICLAYLSSATRKLESAELSQLVETSARNNAAKGLTGMLCYYDGSFLQFLEGARGVVEATLKTIGKDPRHVGLIEMYKEPVDARVFPNWTMALVQVEQMDERQRHALTSLRAFDWDAGPAPEHRAELEDLLDAFRSWLR